MVCKKTILIGNGFNHHFKSYIDNDELKNEIDHITSLWNKFDNLVENNGASIEEIIENLYRAFAFLSSVKPFRENEYKECIDLLREKFYIEFIDMLHDIAYEFAKQQLEGFYGQLKSYLCENIFDNFVPCEIIKNKKINVYTTNYDGIAEMILGHDGKNFQLPDGFRHDGNYVCFNKEAFDEDLKGCKLFHLHGSYKFYKLFEYEDYRFAKEIKFKFENSDSLNEFENNKQNLEPIIILNAVNLKEKQIKNYFSLSMYLSAFEKDLKKSDTLIIWGQSLKNDPHLKDRIKKYYTTNNEYNEKKRIIIIDTNENHTLKEELNDNEVDIKVIQPNNRDFIDILKMILND